ncbi:MAG: ATP-dependent protease ATPase subunit HslU [Spirochaetales bacterium]|nr:ATP-dependent protease ATPase subunit HslU [Spirochaetales bacterium]
MRRKDLDTMTPAEIVEELDKYIISQDKAKRAVAIALRSRIRRKKLPDSIRDEVAPKNIIMIGPTGVGKTEIARRLSKLSGAPFIKVEATKFTEVGYVGRDVESMIRDLMSVAVSMVKAELAENVQEAAERNAEEQLLNLLLPGVKSKEEKKNNDTEKDTGKDKDVIVVDALGRAEKEHVDYSGTSTREKFRRMLREGKLDDKEINVSVTAKGPKGIELLAGGNLEDMENALNSIGSIFGKKKKKKRVTVKQAKQILLDDEMEKLIDTDNASDIAKERVEQMGIIFIDEIDKVAAGNRGGGSGPDISREGVQRDILPIVEGSKVNTKYGIIDTSHILFIAAGAFHMSKPSDLIPELQGRFPIRVELNDLSSKDFCRILEEPENAMIKQYIELLKTENVELVFTKDAIEKLGEIAAEVNSKTENIGARRLHTIMELLLDDVSFNASDMRGQTVTITGEYVDERLSDIVQNQDLSRYIL